MAAWKGVSWRGKLCSRTLQNWNPPSSEKGKALYSSHPELLARFVKEAALQKREMFPDIDHVDVTARQETLASFQGQPALLQLPIVPSYALTVHKTQVNLCCASERP